MGIFSLIVVLLATAYQSVMSGYSMIVDQSRQREEARSILLMIGREIHGALSPVARSPGVSVSNMGAAPYSVDFLINPPDLNSSTDGAEYANPHTLFWQVPGQHSALVGYVLKWETSGDETSVPVLRRVLSESGRMFELLEGAAEATGSGWANVALIEEVAPADEASSFAGWLSNHVIAFWVRGLDPNGNPIRETARPITGVSTINLPASTFGSISAYSGNYDSKLGYRYGTPLVELFAPALPAAVEIAITTLPPRAMQRVTTVLPVPEGLGGNPDKFHEDIAAFENSLPEEIRGSVKTYSIILPLGGAR